MHSSEIRAIADENKRREAYLAEVASNKYFQDSLALRISCGVSLSEEELGNVVALLSSRCRKQTVNRLYWALRACPTMQSYGIYGRVLLADSKASYCAGQSYPDEIRTVRECLIGR